MEIEQDELYLLLISVHGLIRGHDLELGKDADTGGQTKYVIELARALGEQPNVARVDLATRRIVDKSVSKDYSLHTEPLSDKANIIRIDCADQIYLPKEQLWDHLDIFSDNLLSYLHNKKLTPHIIHSHYADAGYVGTQLSHQLSLPLIHTGHSLGRSKRKHLLASGVKGDDIEKRYNMSRRINAEENTLGIADRVITSTHQEIEEQYGLYDYYQPDQMRVVPPGTDLEKFHPPAGNENESEIAHELNRFFSIKNKPMILALSRPDQRKNIVTLIEAFGESSRLQKLANLVIIAGNREDIRDMETGTQEVLTDILLTIDHYDLYGKVAYPKHHQPDDVSIIYRLATLSGGVFINPALIEPFGLTLIEAAASGLPIVATEDGGPVDIIANCHNGYLIDPLNKELIAEKLFSVLNNKTRWKQFAKKGIAGVNKHYSWQSHAHKYLKIIQPIIEKSEAVVRMELHRRSRLYRDRSIFSDLDQSLLGAPEYLPEFTRVMKENARCSSFGIATGRRLDSALTLIKLHKIPFPDTLVTSLGTEIYYGSNLTRDTAWTDHIDYLWKPAKVRSILKDLPGIHLQPKVEQSSYKISYYYDESEAPDIDEIRHLLLQHELTVNVVFSFGQYLDIVPVRASKGLALRWYAEQWDVPLDHILVAGGSGADEDMIRGNTLAVLVANRHNEELSDLIELERVYYAKRPYAAGILEAIEYYDFFQSCKVPEK
ncbi:MAG: HAD-IIB family hydrolase [Gammaproteobacteria bacterium]|nr:HAD-IIB family hydrolase [Gammaproteobacteria bacterium]MCW9004131.1 HAD-IIB family hydrolase [Gammaproteobacteria bacterium]MCW9055218.1 HAD-IIB family hydrolase [Gammaproteobacteria bacterium]